MLFIGFVCLLASSIHAQIVPGMVEILQPETVSPGITLMTRVFDSHDLIIATMPYPVDKTFFSSQPQYSNKNPSYVRVVATVSGSAFDDGGVSRSLESASSHSEERSADRIKLVIWTGRAITDTISVVMTQAFQSAAHQLLYRTKNSSATTQYPFKLSSAAIPSSVTELEIELLFVDKSTLYRRPLCQPNPASALIRKCPTMILADEMLLPSLIDQNIITTLDRLADSDLVNDIAPSLMNWRVQNVLFSLPMFQEVSVLAFNKATLAKLGLKQPPPYADWGNNNQDWTWDKLVEYATKIHSLGQSGFDFKSGEYEDVKLIQMIARSYNAAILDGNLTSAMTSDSFQKAMKATLGKLWANGAALGNTDFVKDDYGRYSRWVNSPLQDPVISNATIFTGAPVSAVTQGMTIVPSSFIRNGIKSDGSFVGDVAQADILPALVPGVSYIGGSGLSILKTSASPSFAWAIAAFLASSNNDFIDKMSFQQGMPPPYTSKVDSNYWKSDAWNVVRTQMAHAQPFQSPNPIVRYADAFVVYAPLRVFMLELAVKGLSVEDATSRASSIINTLSLPDCQGYTVKALAEECDPDTSYQYVRLTGQGLVQPSCKIDYLQVSTMLGQVTCSYVDARSPVGIAMLFFNSVALATVLILALMVAARQNRFWIVSMSLPYCMTVLLGGLFIVVGCFLLVGVPSSSSCVSRDWLIDLGMVLFAGSFATIAMLFTVTRGVSVAMRQFFTWMFANLVLNVCMMLVWSFVSMAPGKGYLNTVTSDMTGSNVVTVLSPICITGQQAPLIVLVIGNVLFFVVGVLSASRNKEILKGYPETGSLIVALVLTILGVVVISPLVSLLNDLIARHAVMSLATSILLVVVLVLYFVPKLRDERVVNEHSTDSNYLSGEKAEAINRTLAADNYFKRQSRYTPGPEKTIVRPVATATLDHESSFVGIKGRRESSVNSKNRYPQDADITSIESFADLSDVTEDNAAFEQPIGYDSSEFRRIQQTMRSRYASKQIDPRLVTNKLKAEEIKRTTGYSDLTEDSVASGSWYAGSFADLLNEFEETNKSKQETAK